MNDWSLLLGPDQFKIPNATKSALFFDRLRALTKHHSERSVQYRNILAQLWPSWEDSTSLSALPFLPVSLFKKLHLASVPDTEIYSTIRSSGTSGQTPSQIVLDRNTAQLQSRALSAVLGNVLGRDRLPLLIIDRESELRGAQARSIGIRGMLPFSKTYAFALDETLGPDVTGIRRFLDDLNGGPFILFGFTYLVWQFMQAVTKADLNFSSGTLVHSGGWKRLAAIGVSNAEFKGFCGASTSLQRIHNFYGMAEQVGSVFLEDTDGLLRAPACGEVIVRDPHSWAVQPAGVPGVIQVLSALPESYPGHSILTEDLGVVHDDAASARTFGTRFSVMGRLPKAELRGCSDVIAQTA